MRRRLLFFLFCILWLAFPQGVLAEGEGVRPMVQTVMPVDEYRGLVHLGLLETEVNDNGDMSQSVRDVMPAIAQIRVGNFWGSGAILEIGEDDLLLVTNRHVLAHQADMAYVRFYSGASGASREMVWSDRYDLGFVRIDISGWPYEDRRKLRFVNTDSAENLSKGDDIFLVGSTDGVACNVYVGTVADPWYYFEEFDSYMIYNYCKAKGGMSGGGTFDEHGHYIGMVTGGYDDETASLPLSIILEEKDRLFGTNR